MIFRLGRGFHHRSFGLALVRDDGGLRRRTCRSCFRWSSGHDQIEVPKYLRPRTDTPKLTVGYGGCFACIYSVRGAGGYQMFGITPMPIFDPKQEISYLQDFMVFFRPGDIVKFKSIDRAAYDQAVEDVDAGRFAPTIRDVNFSLDEFNADIPAYNQKLGEVLHGN